MRASKSTAAPLIPDVSDTLKADGFASQATAWWTPWKKAARTNNRTALHRRTAAIVECGVGEDQERWECSGFVFSHRARVTSCYIFVVESVFRVFRVFVGLFCGFVVCFCCLLFFFFFFFWVLGFGFWVLVVDF